MFSVGVFVEDDCYGWTVKNNVIYNIGFAGTRHGPQTAGVVNQWVNNTVYNVGVHGMQFYSGNAVIKYNIVDNAGTSQIYVDPNAVSQGNITIDYNDNWTIPEGQRVGNGVVGQLGTSPGGKKIACKCDAHSLNSDPLFVNPPSDFHLQPSSLAHGTGEGGVDMGALMPPTNIRATQILP